MVDRTLIRSELECPAAYVAVAVILGTACACVSALPRGPAEDAAPLAATWSEIRNPFLDLRPRWTRYLGSKGVKAGRGQAKARTSEQARAAIRARWDSEKNRSKLSFCACQVITIFRNILP